jgi:hypothetical protein
VRCTHRTRRQSCRLAYRCSWLAWKTPVRPYSTNRKRPGSEP